MIVRGLLFVYSFFSFIVAIAYLGQLVAKVWNPHMKNLNGKEFLTVGFLVAIFVGLNVFLLKKFWNRE